MTPSEIVNKEYSLSEIAIILNLDKKGYEKLRYYKSVELISLPEGRKKYTFPDLLHIRIVVNLIKQGLKPNKIKTAMEKMRSTFDNLAHPFNRVQVYTDRTIPHHTKWPGYHKACATTELNNAIHFSKLRNNPLQP